MARQEFGQSVADFVVVPSDGIWAVGAGVDVTFWDAALDGTQYTDLLDSTGANIDHVTSDEFGALPRFFGPEGVTGMWADAGGGSRAWIEAHSVTTGAPGVQSVYSVNQVPPDGDGDVRLSAADLGIHVQEAAPSAPAVGDVWLW